MFYWKSKKQNTVSLSSCEAEYMALTVATQVAEFLAQLFSDFIKSDNLRPVKLHADNTGAIELSKNPVFHQRSKLIDIKYHFIRLKVENKFIYIHHVPSELN